MKVIDEIVVRTEQSDKDQTEQIQLNVQDDQNDGKQQEEEAQTSSKNESRSKPLQRKYPNMQSTDDQDMLKVGKKTSIEISTKQGEVVDIG